ncbi:MAG TPA: hypothetical protein VN512_04695 [Clostridia bacterium]|nr:hypothetical protein [Clostridia bacterium]
MQTVYFSLEASIILTFLAAAMWGSWMQIINHLKGYPISGVIFWLYTFSFVLIWGITLAVAPSLLEHGILATTKLRMDVIPKIILGGAMMSLGLYFSLKVIGSVGLILSTTVSGGIGTLLGLGTSIFEEGLPKGKNVVLLLTVTTIMLIAAGFLSSYASQLRDKERGKAKKESGAVSGKIVLFMLLSAVLTNGWSMGTATGIASGLPPILTCAYMATGSFLSIAVICGVAFTVKKQWKQVLCIGTSKKPLALCAISSVCHYGGNLISIYSMPAISATISFLLGKSSGVWTIFWGGVYKEFSGVSNKTRAFLYISVLLYLLGTAFLTMYKFG